jgi:hypothetical protein
MQSKANYRFLRRLRAFLLLSRIDVQIGSSVRVNRLAAAEAEQLELSRSELAMLNEFYEIRLRFVMETEGIPGWPAEAEMVVTTLGQA